MSVWSSQPGLDAIKDLDASPQTAWVDIASSCAAEEIRITINSTRIVVDTEDAWLIAHHLRQAVRAAERPTAKEVEARLSVYDYIPGNIPDYLRTRKT